MATLEQQVYDGEKAREVLENDVFKAVFADIDKELTEAWKKSPVRDEAGRQSIYLMQTMLYKVENVLIKTLETGKLAKAELQHKQNVADRLRESLRPYVPF